MAVFRFRAAAALDLRQAQERAAQLELARAEAAFLEAESQLAAADQDRRRAQDDAVSATRRGIDANALLWHRNWIARLADVIERRRRELDTRSTAFRQADQAWRDARRRRLALERMRERAWRRHQQAEHRHELKLIDELARLRFIAADAWRDDP